MKFVEKPAWIVVPHPLRVSWEEVTAGPMRTVQVTWYAEKTIVRNFTWGLLQVMGVVVVSDKIYKHIFSPL